MSSLSARDHSRFLSIHVADILRDIERVKSEREGEAALRARAALASPYFKKSRRRV